MELAFYGALTPQMFKRNYFLPHCTNVGNLDKTPLVRLSLMSVSL